jgi:broad specificity phosphatase PhoE
MLLKSVQERLKTLVVSSEKILKVLKRKWQGVKEWVSHKVKLLKVVVLLCQIDENELNILSDKYKKEKGKRPEKI